MLSIRKRSHLDDARRRRARAAGQAAALGLDEPVPDAPARHAGGSTCSHCGARGRLDMVDMPDVRAYFTCPRCTHTWDTDRVAARTR